MYSLFIDSSVVDKTHIALWQNAELSYYHRAAKLPAELIAAAMHRSKRQLSELSFLTLILGPGSYTNLRSGICAVKALSYALKIPVITLNWLQIRAALYTQEHTQKYIQKHTQKYVQEHAQNFSFPTATPKLLPIMHAIRDYFYFQVIADNSSAAPMRLSQTEIANFAKQHQGYVWLPIVLEGDSFPNLPVPELAEPCYIQANYETLLAQIQALALNQYQAQNLVKHSCQLDFAPLYFAAPVNSNPA